MSMHVDNAMEHLRVAAEMKDDGKDALAWYHIGLAFGQLENE